MSEFSPDVEEILRILDRPTMKRKRPMSENDSNRNDWEWFGGVDHDGGDPSEWPEDLRVREYPSVAAQGELTS